MKEAKEPTPRQKVALRHGTCFALGCRGCDGYAHDFYADGFNHCTCGHTQNSHHHGEDEADE